MKTVLHKPHSAANFAYDRVPWQLKIRKEVFSPAEEVRSPMAVNLIFGQERVTHTTLKFSVMPLMICGDATQVNG